MSSSGQDEMCKTPSNVTAQACAHRDLSFSSGDVSLKVPSFKPRAGWYILRHAMPAARDFSLANFYPSSPFTCIFSKTSPKFFLCWLWLTPVPV